MNTMQNPNIVQIVQDLRPVIMMLNARRDLWHEMHNKKDSFAQINLVFQELIQSALGVIEPKYKDGIFCVKNTVRPHASPRKIKLARLTFDERDLFSYNPSTALYFIPDSDKYHPIHYGWIMSYVVNETEYPIKWER